MKLKDIECKRAGVPPGKTQTKLFDGEGLYLLVRPSSKTWKRKYRFQGKEKTLTFGTYPQISLKEARKEKDKSKLLLDKGVDPSQSSNQETGPTFREVADRWAAKRKHVLAENTFQRDWRVLENHVFPWIADRSINQVSSQELLKVFERIENRGKITTAHKAKELCGSIFKYARSAYGITNNPTADLSGALIPIKPINRAALVDPKEISQLLKSISQYSGSIITRVGLWVSAYTFVRPGELRHMEWKELDFKKEQWIIPKEKMKMRRAHIVPLSSQVIELLHQMKEMEFGSKYVFSGCRSKTRPMSENTINAAIRYLGYEKDEMCAHGFRGMASTQLHELGYNSEIIELQLAHKPLNKIMAAYNHAQYLPERIKMMQEWANYLDQLKDIEQSF